MHLLINVELHLLHSHMQQLHNVISVVFTSKILKVHFLFLLFVATIINFEEYYWNCQEKGREENLEIL